MHSRASFALLVIIEIERTNASRVRETRGRFNDANPTIRETSRD